MIGTGRDRSPPADHGHHMMIMVVIDLSPHEDVWQLLVPNPPLETLPLGLKAVYGCPLQFQLSRRLIRLGKVFEPPKMEVMPRARLLQENVLAFCEKYVLLLLPLAGRHLTFACGNLP
jgi:hypothetical protein